MENLEQISFIYNGAIENLSHILRAEKASKTLVFSGKKSFDNIKIILDTKLKGYKTCYYNDFTTNPKEEDIQKATKTIKCKYDIIIAIGGGSVIDFAKAFRYYAKSPCKLIAIPTTCGTGSESTQFAVLYKNGKKTSLDNQSILPHYAIVDSQFVKNNPQYLKACSSLDSFTQAIESYWAVQSTDKSKEYAKKAIVLCKENIVPYVKNGLNADKMMLASNLAGKAINISRTTAAHALSYAITTKYGIPHGHAVALSMKDLFKANLEVDSHNCNDLRGEKYVKETLNDILNLLKIDNFDAYWENLLKEIGIEYSFSRLQINDKEFIVESVNAERLKNNPVDLGDKLHLFWR